MQIKQTKKLKGEITVPGDKSISHRGIMLNALSKGTGRVSNFLTGEDCLCTIHAFRKLGVDISVNKTECVIRGNGLKGLKAPLGDIDCGNSGTTARLMCGILAAQYFESRLIGDFSLTLRPMKRIIEPLSLMGADIRSDSNCLPLEIYGQSLSGINYLSPVASAQVKSSVLLAGLYADGSTCVTEPAKSRDHTERILPAFGVNVSVDGLTVKIEPADELYAQDIKVPGDISSASYFLAAASICPDAEVMIKNVGINPTRAGIIEVLRLMGANFAFIEEKNAGAEPCADILIKSSSLHGCVIEGDMIPALIDELPVIAVMAACAKEDTIIKDAKELRVKESDRISATADGLRTMGADVEELPDGMIIHGGRPLHQAVIDCHNDHRIAMSFAVAGLVADGVTELSGGECVNISYPDFYRDLFSLT